MSSYDPQNIFGKILRGEIPSAKVYEDETVLVMMDAFPQSRGHVLVLPKAHAQDVRKIVEALSATGFARYL